MTRNEYIAETAARVFCINDSMPSGVFDSCVISARDMADALERSNLAPWQKPSALDPLIERAHLFATFCAVSADVSANMKALAQAWLADYDAAKSKGGA